MVVSVSSTIHIYCFEKKAKYDPENVNGFLFKYFKLS